MSPICQQCRVVAPTRRVAFHQNIGMFIARQVETTEGYLCRNGIGDTFWRYTLVNLTVGWWEVISLLVAPIFTISNLVYYVGSLNLPRVPHVPSRPLLSDEVLARLAPFEAEVLTCLRRGDPPELIAVALTERVDVTATQALVYVQFEVALRGN